MARWYLLLYLLYESQNVNGKFVQGELRTRERWAFLARFCFLSKDGKFSFDVSYNLDFAVQKLLLYFDTQSQWPSVYKSKMDCNEREEIILERPKNRQMINLTMLSSDSECEVTRRPGDRAYYHCRGARAFKSSRERWWFIAVSNCDSTEGLQLKYNLSLTNGYRYWYKHFSADEFYILQTDLAALAIQLGLLLLAIMAAVELKNRQLLHTTYRIYMSALCLQVMSLLFLILHYARYGHDGIGLPGSQLIGRVFGSMSTILMQLLLLLMAKGFTITRGRLRQESAVKLTAFMCFICIAYAGLFIYEQNVFDPGEVLYLYESPAGYGLMVLRFIGWIMFLYACFFTVKHYPEKTSFYYPFCFFYNIWFTSGPLIIIIGNYVIDKWVREKVVNGVEMGITIIGHAFFLFLTRPNAANKNFPYHVRTTQIASMESSPNRKMPGGTLDAFTAHAYAPEFPPEGPKNFTNSDLFLVSGAVEMRPIRGPKALQLDGENFPHHQPGTNSSIFEDKSSPVQRETNETKPIPSAPSIKDA